MRTGCSDTTSDQGILNWFTSWWTAWTAFWFTPSSPVLLGVLRILVGSLLAWSNFVWLLDQEGFFGMQVAGKQLEMSGD